MQIVIDYLADGAWRKIGEITAATGVTREAMSAAGFLTEGLVISHPSRGYKLTRHASREELNASIGNYKARAQAMINRAHATRAAWERHHPGAAA